MKCEQCQGRGTQINPDFDFHDAAVPIIVPCGSCFGSGIASCCEGAVGLAGDVTNTGDLTFGGTTNAAPADPGRFNYRWWRRG